MKNKSEQQHVRGDDESDVQGRGSVTGSLVTEEMVEERARELAVIAGREPNRVIGGDRVQARKELMGDASADDPADDSGIMASGMGSPPTSHGHKVENHLPEDDKVAEETVQEGVDAAEHETMTEASRRRES